jgi:hypothetical protein
MRFQNEPANMKRITLLILLCLLLPNSSEGQNTLRDKWVFSFGYRRNSEDVEQIKSLIRTSADHGLNGIVLSSFALDRVSAWSGRDHEYFRGILDLCAEKNIELIPTGFSVGYGTGALAADPNFAAAVPVTIRLVAGDGILAPVGAGRNLVENGGLEKFRGKRLADFAFHDKPGEISFTDSDIAYSGGNSLRFENFTASPHGHGRLMQEIELQAGCTYLFTIMIKTENLNPSSSLRLAVYKNDQRLTSIAPKMESTQDWTEASLEFTSREKQKVRVYAGSWGAESGTFWLDDVQVAEHSSLASIVRREGAPLELTGDGWGKTYMEGVDFEEVVNDPDMRFIRLLPGTRIKDGEELTLSFYKTSAVPRPKGKQFSLCMSNPALYTYWEEEARALYAIHQFKKFLLSMDEIRNGGGCELCRKSGKSMAQILGDCITRQCEILKRLDPGMEVYIWSDMLDPYHNARDNYYNVVGDFTGSWEYVPKDLIIFCWYHKIRDQSLRFFSSKGFRTAGASYYDADDLSNVRDWLASLEQTPNAVGIMYTSWRQKYNLLDEFGKLVSE